MQCVSRAGNKKLGFSEILRTHPWSSNNICTKFDGNPSNRHFRKKDKPHGGARRVRALPKPSSGNHERLHKIYDDSSTTLLSYLSLDQSGGPAIQLILPSGERGQ